MASAQSRLGSIPQTITDEETGEEKENPEYAAAAQAVAEAQEAYNTAQEEVNAAQRELDAANAKQQTIQQQNQTALDELSSAQEKYESELQKYEAEVEAQMEEEAEEENYDDVAEEETQNSENCEGGAKDPIEANYNGAQGAVKIGDDEINIDSNTTIYFGIDSNNNGAIDDNSEVMGYEATMDEMEKLAGEDGKISIQEYVNAGGVVVIKGKAYNGEEALLALTKLNNPDFDKLSDKDKEKYMNRTLFNVSEYREKGEEGDVIDLKGENVGFLDFKQTFKSDEQIAKEFGFDSAEGADKKEEQVEYLNDGKLVQDGNLTPEGVSAVKDTLKKSAEDLGLTEDQIDKMDKETIQKYFSIDKKGNLALKNIDYWNHGEAKGKADCPWNFATEVFEFKNLQNTDKLFNALFGESVKALSGHWNANLNGSTGIKVEVATKTEAEQALEDVLPQAGGDWTLNDREQGKLTFESGENKHEIDGLKGFKDNKNGTYTAKTSDGKEVTITPQNGGYVIEYPPDENGAVIKTILTEDGVKTERVITHGSSQGATTTTTVYDGAKDEGTPEKTITETTNKDGKTVTIVGEKGTKTITEISTKDGKTVTIVDEEGNKTIIEYDTEGKEVSRKQPSSASPRPAGEAVLKDDETNATKQTSRIPENAKIADIPEDISDEELAKYAAEHDLTSNKTNGENSQWLANRLAKYANSLDPSDPNYENAIKAISRQLNKSMKGLGRDDDFMEQLFKNMTEDTYKKVEEDYNKTYPDNSPVNGRDALVNDISNEKIFSGIFREKLMGYLKNGNKDETLEKAKLTEIDKSNFEYLVQQSKLAGLINKCGMATIREYMINELGYSESKADGILADYDIQKAKNSSKPQETKNTDEDSIPRLKPDPVGKKSNSVEEVYVSEDGSRYFYKDEKGDYQEIDKYTVDWDYS